MSGTAGLEDTSPAVGGGVVKLLLMVAYDGTGYQGWQVQKIGLGVQQLVEEAVGKIFPGAGRLRSSSRTDTGVHAVGMVVDVEVPAERLRMPLRKVPLALNAWLPADIRVMAARRVGAGFHARFDALGKEYRYRVWNHPVMNPLLRGQAWHVPRPLDVGAMQSAAGRLVGRRDFRSFAGTHPYEVPDTVRTLRRLSVRRRGSEVTFVLEADGFLYKMCRGIVGTLVQLGLGRFDEEAMMAMVAARDRRVAGVTAPAHGLVLWKVFYGRGRRGQRMGGEGLAGGRAGEGGEDDARGAG